jgi:tripartite-type tricarboxylate transporter receptor subunit TctC
VLPYAATGKLKVLAVSGQASPQAPDVATLREAGMENYSVNLSVLAVRRRPHATRHRQPPAASCALLADPELSASLTRQGVILRRAGDELRPVRDELVTWRKLVKDAKITADQLCRIAGLRGATLVERRRCDRGRDRRRGSRNAS